MAVIGRKHCSRRGNMQALKVNSSDSGATTWLRSQIKFVKFDIQYMGSKRKQFSYSTEYQSS